MDNEVFVVRDSECGQGDDDPGHVLGVFTCETKANKFAEKSVLNLHNRGIPRIRSL